MCGLCAAYNANRGWTDLAGRAGFSQGDCLVNTRDERERIIALLGHIMDFYGLKAIDWGGSSYLVSTVAGKNENVYNLSGIWHAADRLLGEAVLDPLEAELIERLEGLVEGADNEA
jgi:hypothetical protein